MTDNGLFPWRPSTCQKGTTLKKINHPEAVPHTKTLFSIHLATWTFILSPSMRARRGLKKRTWKKTTRGHFACVNTFFSIVQHPSCANIGLPVLWGDEAGIKSFAWQRAQLKMINCPVNAGPHNVWLKLMRLWRRLKALSLLLTN